MTVKTLAMEDGLYQYLTAHNPAEDTELAALRERTRHMAAARMQIAPEQGHFLKFLVSLLGVKRYLEIGVFTGYSSLAVAQALPADGYILACDINSEWTGIAAEHWHNARVSKKIDLRLAPALDTLQLCLEQRIAPFDLIFIDADKSNYLLYYKMAKQLLSARGLILVDNVLWSGRVAEEDAKQKDTLAIQALNHYVRNDDSVEFVMIPIADGMTLIKHASL